MCVSSVNPLFSAVLVFADCLTGAATLIAGIYRLQLVASGNQNRQMTRWECVWTPHFVILTFSAAVQVGMLLQISLDRFFAVSLPFKYRTLTRKYSILMICACFTLAAGYTASMVVHVYITVTKDTENKQKVISAMCFMCDVDKVFDSYFYVRVTTAGLSVFVYIVVWYLYRKYQRKMISVEGFMSTTYRMQRLQCQLTATVGICALFTFGLYIMPNCLVFLASRMRTGTDFVAPVTWLVNCCNSIVNIFVYSMRHQDIRSGLKVLFSRRELPVTTSRRFSAESTVFTTSKW